MLTGVISLKCMKERNTLNTKSKVNKTDKSSFDGVHNAKPLLNLDGNIFISFLIYTGQG